MLCKLSCIFGIENTISNNWELNFKPCKPPNIQKLTTSGAIKIPNYWGKWNITDFSHEFMFFCFPLGHISRGLSFQHWAAIGVALSFLRVGRKVTPYGRLTWDYSRRLRFDCHWALRQFPQLHHDDRKNHRFLSNCSTILPSFLFFFFYSFFITSCQT